MLNTYPLQDTGNRKEKRKHEMGFHVLWLLAHSAHLRIPWPLFPIVYPATISHHWLGRWVTMPFQISLVPPVCAPQTLPTSPGSPNFSISLLLISWTGSVLTWGISKYHKAYQELFFYFSVALFDTSYTYIVKPCRIQYGYSSLSEPIWSISDTLTPGFQQ